MAIREASGASVRPEMLEFKAEISAADFGLASGRTAVENTEAINAALRKASDMGGASVIIPAGEFSVYTIRLQNNVNLHLDKGAVLRAAGTQITDSYVTQMGEGGNYDEPEVNLYAGLQDHGHTYFANSLIYGADLNNVMISGDGLIDGSRWNEKENCREFILLGGDPFDGEKRSCPGHRGEWFGNKGIALVRCRNVVLKDFSVIIGGHFAVIAEGVTDMYVDGILIDTNRDAFDVDCCRNVTVRNSVFNSLTDDGLVLKSSFGAGRFIPIENVLIEDCSVSGYDAGSVYAGTFTNEKLVAEDRCGPTGRVKLGTESSGGYHLVTIRRVKFTHARGFALEAVDGSDLTDIIFEKCSMEYVSSSPIFIRTGDRCRFPVTGMSKNDDITLEGPDVRIDNKNFIIPDTQEYENYPPVRYVPSYNKTKKVTVDQKAFFEVIDEKEPLRFNPANSVMTDGRYYAVNYSREHGYVPDMEREIDKREAYIRANACSRPIAAIRNIRISDVEVKKADPRYPIIIMGLDSSTIDNVILENISVSYRGGITMEQAVEQRQLNTAWEYTQYQTKPSVQSIPWLVNTFFLKNEGLLPRADWDSKRNCWKDDPYNVPELPGSYPEPSNWGILPAYGLYARHVRGLKVKNTVFSTEIPDTRHAVVLDDVEDVAFSGLSCETADTEAVAFVTNNYKRPTNMEYVPDEPYHMTSVRNVQVPEKITIKLALVDAPAPGTPGDSLYSYPTLPTSENGYHYRTETEELLLPKTVYPPFIRLSRFVKTSPGETVKEKLLLRDPSEEICTKELPGRIYNESVSKKDPLVRPEVKKSIWTFSGIGIPQGAVLSSQGDFEWTPGETQTGEYCFTVTASKRDSDEKVSAEMKIIVQ